jgi:hypothetical protein
MYEVDRIYIWQNQVGEFAYLNGRETTVVGPMTIFQYRGRETRAAGWPTDTPVPNGSVSEYIFAGPRDLRRKDPPSGERSILAMFRNHMDLALAA